MGIALKKLGFKRGETLFSELDFHFAKGALSVLTGDSGSGKSTLLRLIAGFAQLPYTGEILLNGRNYQQANMQEKARQVGMMFQNPDQQFTMSSLKGELYFAMENLNFTPRECQGRFQKAVDTAGTRGLLTRDLRTLSGGEKQKAALTVLLALDPPIFLLDEPFASIDPKSRQDLIKKLGELRDRGKTILVCDHDLRDYHQVVDHLVELKKGTLQERSLTELAGICDQFSLSQKHSGKTLLTMKNVLCRQDKKVLIKDCDWIFQRGVTTLTGENGSGKSTLLRSLVQLQPYQGKMFFESQRLRKSKKLYQTMTLAVQDAAKQFVALTPAAELAFSQKITPENAAKQREALNYLGLAAKKAGSIYQLSEGQKKMVQLIALLSLERRFLLLDEPFTGLDELACRYFTAWIKEKAAAGQSFLIVSHRLAPLVSISQQHVVLENQRLQSFEEKGA